MKYVINNIVIRFDLDSKKWQCVSPDGRILEEFKKGHLDDAINWATNTLDFVRKENV